MYRRAVLFAGIGDGEIATETEKRASDGLMKLETFLSEPGSADFVVKRTMARRLCASLNRARQTRPIFTSREGCPLAGLTRPFQRTRRAAWGTGPLAGDCLRARGGARREAHRACDDLGTHRRRTRADPGRRAWRAERSQRFVLAHGRPDRPQSGFERERRFFSPAPSASVDENGKAPIDLSLPSVDNP